MYIIYDITGYCTNTKGIAPHNLIVILYWSLNLALSNDKQFVCCWWWRLDQFVPISVSQPIIVVRQGIMFVRQSRIKYVQNTITTGFLVLKWVGRKSFPPEFTYYSRFTRKIYRLFSNYSRFFSLPITCVCSKLFEHNPPKPTVPCMVFACNA